MLLADCTSADSAVMGLAFVFLAAGAAADEAGCASAFRFDDFGAGAFGLERRRASSNLSASTSKPVFGVLADGAIVATCGRTGGGKAPQTRANEEAPRRRRGRGTRAAAGGGWTRGRGAPPAFGVPAAKVEPHVGIRRNSVGRGYIEICVYLEKYQKLFQDFIYWLFATES